MLAGSMKGARGAHSAFTQAELEAQSAIPSAGKESGKESADSAKPQSDGALKAVMIRQS